MYKSKKDEVNQLEKLDFPKGKADEGETDEECAIREINEEIGINISSYINKEQFIRIETIKGKFVKLFLVRSVGIDESHPALQAINNTN